METDQSPPTVATNPKWPDETKFVKELTELVATTPPISQGRMKRIVHYALSDLKWHKHVVAQIEKFIAKSPLQFRLSALYIIDAICRASRTKYGDKEPFVSRFSRNIKKTFNYIFDCVPTDQGEVRRVIALWHQNKTFPLHIFDTLNAISLQKTGVAPNLNNTKKEKKESPGTPPNPGVPPTLYPPAIPFIPAYSIYPPLAMPPVTTLIQAALQQQMLQPQLQLLQHQQLHQHQSIAQPQLQPQQLQSSSRDPRMRLSAEQINVSNGGWGHATEDEKVTKMLKNIRDNLQTDGASHGPRPETGKRFNSNEDYDGREKRPHIEHSYPPRDERYHEARGDTERSDWRDNRGRERIHDRDDSGDRRYDRSDRHENRDGSMNSRRGKGEWRGHNDNRGGRGDFRSSWREK